MTEEEAKGKICPILPLWQDAPFLCHAAGCLAWRWTMNQSGIPSKDDGFCGLAGKP